MSKVKSLRGINYVQPFCYRANFVKGYPIKLKSHAYHSLDRFIHEVGVPTELLTDGARNLSNRSGRNFVSVITFIKYAQNHDHRGKITLNLLEVYSNGRYVTE